jgi:hypothetical protein
VERHLGQAYSAHLSRFPHLKFVVTSIKFDPHHHFVEPHPDFVDLYDPHQFVERHLGQAYSAHLSRFPHLKFVVPLIIFDPHPDFVEPHPDFVDL